MSFEIHKQLLADTYYLGKLDVCHILLHKNAVLPWFILVPETTENDLLVLPVREREKIMDECAALSGWLKQYFKLQKINFATIGNIVPQLHLHVIGRYQNDACWPRPVWGHLQEFKNYTSDEVSSISKELLSYCNQSCEDDPVC